MSRKYKIRDSKEVYFVTFATVNWVDVFTRPLYKDIFIESLRFCIQNKGLVVYGYVLMTNHVHLIIASEGDELEHIIRDLKKFTSRKIIHAIEQNIQESRREWLLWMFRLAGKRNPNNTIHQFWRQDNKPISLGTGAMVLQKLEYIHQNPVVQGIVGSAEDYVYSSA